MAIRLRILKTTLEAPAEPGPASERALDLDDASVELRVGRRAGLEVVLPFPAVSPLHARFVGEGAVWMVEDLGSEGGTWIGERRLARGEREAIAPGATVRFAHIAVVFDGSAARADGAESTATIARRLVRDLFGALGQGRGAELVSLSGGGTLALAEVERRYVVGRAETCDLVLAADHVSREHAAFVRRLEGVFVRDLDSKNGVVVAGRPVEGEVRLRDGDLVEVGAVTLRLDDPEDRYLRRLEEPAAPAEPAPVSADPAPTAPSPGNLGRAAIVVASAILVAITALLVALALWT